jgi:hypothetical protein
MVGADAEERHQPGRAAEWIRDRLAAVEGQRRQEPAVDLGNQHLAGGHPGAVELGQGHEAIRVACGGESEDEA